MVAGHLMKTWSNTQPTIALSSGEAELPSIVKGATHSLGFQSVANDLGFRLHTNLWADATAAIGICRRRGLGKVRHLSCADLWIQKRLRTGDMTLPKIASTINPAECLTRFVDKQTLQKTIPLMGLNPSTRRPDSAASLTHCVTLQVPRDLPRPCKHKPKDALYGFMQPFNDGVFAFL